jgi:hypothetical protein
VLHFSLYQIFAIQATKATENASQVYALVKPV